MTERQREISVDRPRCPFCRDDLLAEQEKTGCSVCMAWHHAECWQEHGACCACGASAGGDDSRETTREPEPEDPAADDAALTEISELARRGQRTQATELALNPPLPRVPHDPLIEKYVRENLMISALIRYRELHGGDYRSAKRAVEAIREELGVAPVKEGCEILVALALLFAAIVAIVARDFTIGTRDRIAPARL